MGLIRASTGDDEELRAFSIMDNLRASPKSPLI
jgi:hypothetical protein